MSNNKGKYKKGCRYLVYDWHVGKEYPDEVIVVEISPSEERVKFQYPNGNCVWKEAERYDILEKLPRKVFR